MKKSLAVKYLVRACLLALSCWVCYEVYVLVGQIGLVLLTELSMIGSPFWAGAMFTGLGWFLGLACAGASFYSMVRFAESLGGLATESKE